MRRLIYTSFARERMLPESLFELLRKARTANSRSQISGVLFYHDGCFLQCLEGPTTSVNSLLHSIQRDGRHQSVTLLYDDPQARGRLFRQWAMGFFHMNAIEEISPPGLLSNSDTVEELFSGAASTDPAAQLIAHFWRSNLARADRRNLPAA
ncbi:MAG: BLUF domain-containing protein [Gammaproteobacteria bacterium]|nr:BLUF domain-containing protein [Gammaproteobacteria bacterium]MCC5869684.1 BLUF domain-containing protein [Gammaproteobacteria bacterium]TVS09523.1 MAG: BLUF domain-containing protein [Gammaproteobacteria bacterium]